MGVLWEKLVPKTRPWPVLASSANTRSPACGSQTLSIAVMLTRSPKVSAMASAPRLCCLVQPISEIGET